MLVEIWAQLLSARWQRVSKLALLLLAAYVPHSLLKYFQLTTVGGCLTLRHGLLHEADTRCSYLRWHHSRCEACSRSSTCQLRAREPEYLIFVVFQLSRVYLHLHGTNLHGVIVYCTNLDCPNLNFTNLDFTNLDFTNLDFTNLDFTNLDFTNLETDSIWTATRMELSRLLGRQCQWSDTSRHPCE